MKNNGHKAERQRSPPPQPDGEGGASRMNVHILDDSYVDATHAFRLLLSIQAEGGLEAVRLCERIMPDA
jgi:hypothetical protein